MRRKNVRGNSCKKALSLFLAIAILCSALVFVGATPLGTSGITPASATLAISSRVVDPNTSTTMEFSDVPWAHDGRIWTDKSVGTGTAAGDDFTVTLSALSQSF
ncbi:MAG: hypothetical protein FWD84_06795, partial [Oscillospiraceae bacterium]|nr:hypothetical protein [Oscillospiraceae bacterium]